MFSVKPRGKMWLGFELAHPVILLVPRRWLQAKEKYFNILILKQTAITKIY